MKFNAKKALYILPSLCTLCSAFCAFTSMSFAMRGQAQTGNPVEMFKYACMFIFFSTIFDMFDGKIARWTKTATLFGKELDSLADAISFGVAPAVLIYAFSLTNLGWWGIVAAFIYAACTILRLARFNIEAPDEGVQHYFKGLSSPGGAVLVASLVLFLNGHGISPSSLLNGHLLPIVAIATGLLMVSGIRYRTYKDGGLKIGDYLFFIIGFGAFGLLWAFQGFTLAFFVLVLYYVSCGIIFTIATSFKHVVAREIPVTDSPRKSRKERRKEKREKKMMEKQEKQEKKMMEKQEKQEEKERKAKEKREKKEEKQKSQDK